MDVRRLPPPPRTGKLEAPPGLEPGMEVLQTSALPLGDGAVRTATRAAREDSRSRSLGGQVQPFERGEALIDLAGGRWSGKRDSNPRLRPWQGRTLPLSYSRSPRTLRQRYHRERLRFKALSRPGLAPRGSDQAGGRSQPCHPAAGLSRSASRRAAATGSGRGPRGRRRNGQPAAGAAWRRRSRSATGGPVARTGADDPRRSMGAAAGHDQRAGQPAPNAFRINVTSGASPAPACTATTSKRHGRADQPACAM